MAWSTPRTWTTGELVTAAMLNQEIRDNSNALNDKLDDVSASEPSRALDTVYPNDSGKVRVVTVQILFQMYERCEILCDASTPPTTLICKAGIRLENGLSAGNVYIPVTFIVPPSYYYKVATAYGTPTLEDWHEWDLL